MKKSYMLAVSAVVLGMGLAARADEAAAPVADAEGFVKVESTVLDAVKIEKVRYDATTSVLTLVFDSGEVVAYDEVPPSIYTDLLAAPSKGKYFNASIKGKFAHRVLTPGGSAK